MDFTFRYRVQTDTALVQWAPAMKLQYWTLFTTHIPMFRMTGATYDGDWQLQSVEGVQTAAFWQRASTFRPLAPGRRNLGTFHEGGRERKNRRRADESEKSWEKWQTLYCGEAVYPNILPLPYPLIRLLIYEYHLSSLPPPISQKMFFF
jgi:hypothetical protein